MDVSWLGKRRFFVGAMVAAVAVGASLGPARAQLFSGLPINTAELGGFVVPSKWEFFSQEFWVVQRWRKDDGVSLHAAVVAIDRGRLANIVDDAPRIAGAVGKDRARFSYTGTDAAADALSSGRGKGPSMCGSPFLSLDGPGYVGTTSANVLEVGQIRGGLAWASVTTRIGGTKLSETGGQEMRTNCPTTAAAAIAQPPPTGWTVQSPRWMHLVATWLAPGENVDLVKIDPSASLDDAAAGAAVVPELGARFPIDVTGSVPTTRCGTEGRVVTLHGGASSLSSGTIRETLVRGKSAVYAFFETEASGATLPADGPVAAFCPKD